MTFGQQPGSNGQYNTPDYNAAQVQYAQGYTQAAAATIDATAAYSYEQARRVSVTRAYGEMTIGLIVTTVVAVLTQATDALLKFLSVTGMIGLIALCVVPIVMAVVLGVRIAKMSVTTARVMFYLFAVIMGFVLSVIFMVYDLGSIGVALGITAAFFFALTMFGMTTKFNMLKAGPILMVALIVLIISQIVLMFVNVGAMTQIMCAVGLVLFAGMTIYDAQSTRALFTQYEAQGPEMIKKISILCALNLYLDFVNMFLYILQLLGSKD
ncbi:Bax inhibitor-1/YccA family protein [Bifidobacterium panos]|uniref:Inhibitor of apoptosis-promoting Bax1 n=1 Tax=Bifidobacterium panos TaxID=2675321 RepID=A0ABX1SWJ9_9BIFI|nr:Bax inhibitor-1/YccA family protein [Bifidobacterium sp. DSM 109963]NMN02221.1 Inhibitor of apoptosis-promoting Bax1 [Bifidobacterium sp. DSM 109963]